MMSDVDGALAAVTARLQASTVRVHDEGGRGSGSGIVWRAGLILTNAHVVRGAVATIEANGRTHRSWVVARDDARDLAALRVEHAARLALADVRDSATLVPGEWVVAVGNPHGIEGAVTAGIVHRSNRRWVVADVRLAPGNSGGPLSDAQGRVVGINSMVVNGLAYAIPSAAAQVFAAEVLRRRRAA